jgi:hypothetical protein
LGVPVAVAALLLCVWLLSQINGAEARQAIIALAVGIAVYAVFRWKYRGGVKIKDAADNTAAS